jgi:hypothetical protein
MNDIVKHIETFAKLGSALSCHFRERTRPQGIQLGRPQTTTRLRAPDSVKKMKTEI